MTKHLKNHIEALLVMGFMDLKLKYQGSLLGFFWSFLKPLLQFSIYYFIFAQILHLNSGPGYALKLFFGVMTWAWFAEGTSLGLNAFLGKRVLVTKIKINHLLPPLAAFLTSTFTYIINFILFSLIFLVLGYHHLIHFGWTQYFLLIYSIFCLSTLIISLNLILSNLNVFFRDVQTLWELVLMYGVFLTPVIYPISLSPRWKLPYYLTNLLAAPLENMKSVFFVSQNTLLSSASFLLLYNMILVSLFMLAYYTHIRLSKKIADYL